MYLRTKNILLVFSILLLSYCSPKKQLAKNIEKNGVKALLVDVIADEELQIIFEYYQKLPEVMRNRDANALLKYFSKQFIGPNGETYEQIESQLPEQYKIATKILYQASNIKIFKKGKLIVSQNDFKTEVTRADNSTHSVSGIEQIFWQKGNRRLEIIHWEKL